jgi:hypothetical protein
LTSSEQAKLHSLGWRRLLVIVACALALLVAFAGRATANGGKHHPVAAGHAIALTYLAKDVEVHYTSESGKPLKSSAAASKGDRLTILQEDYAGNLSHHAAKASATGRLSCVFLNATEATCHNVLSIHGSEIVTKPGSLSLDSSVAAFGISGGTGKYQGARGLFTSTQVEPKMANISIVLEEHSS